ncbi:MAG: peptide deformylase [Flavobacteriales bacterium]|nr:peptide deformylase [Flavobacteriales bacterium]
MIYPIVAYGDPVLRRKAEEIDENYPDLDTFIANMFETMYASNGVGLAAPQVGKSIRLFVMDADTFSDEEPELADFKKVFINPIIIEETGEKWAFNEGCLSIPKIREDIWREPEIVVEYYDENWILHEETFKGMAARIIQHEYDHLDGILFIDHINPLRKKMLSSRLKDISRGRVRVDYKMKFPLK